MTRRRRRALQPLSLWVDAIETGLATATTLAMRLPRLAQGTMTPAESRRMVGEKISAAAEGMVAGAVVTSQIAAKRMRRPAPSKAWNDVLEIASAAWAPARRRVKQNAVRLTIQRVSRRS